MIAADFFAGMGFSLSFLTIAFKRRGGDARFNLIKITDGLDRFFKAFCAKLCRSLWLMLPSFSIAPVLFMREERTGL
jgi:hypothetical protein